MAIENFSNSKRIAKNTLFLYGRMLLVLFVSIYTTRVLLNILGVEDYGIYNVVCGFVMMFGFLNTSLSNGIQRFYNYEYAIKGEEGVKRVYQTALFIQSCLAIVIAVLLEVVGIWYINNIMVIPDERIIAANWIFQFSIISLILVILQIPYNAAILAHEHMDFYAIVSIVDVLLKLITVMTLPYLKGDQLIVYGVFNLLISALNFILYVRYSKKNFKELVFERVFHKDLFTSIFKFSGWNILATFAWMTQGQGINMVINLYFGSIINAARGVSGQIQAAIQGFCENIIVAFRPQLVQSYAQGNLEKTDKMMYSMSKVIFIMFFLLSTPVIFEIEFILHLWLGESIPDYTAPFTILVLLSMYPRNFSMVFAQVVHATGRLGLYQISSTIVIILVLPLSYVALSLGADVISVYWINLFMCILLFLLSMFVFKRIYPIKLIDYVKKVILPCLFVGIVVSLTLYYIINCIPQSLFRFFLTIITTLVLTCTIVYLLILSNEEKQIIKQILKK